MPAVASPASHGRAAEVSASNAERGEVDAEHRLVKLAAHSRGEEVTAGRRGQRGDRCVVTLELIRDTVVGSIAAGAGERRRRVELRVDRGTVEVGEVAVVVRADRRAVEAVQR